jgi:hypothetical protein
MPPHNLVAAELKSKHYRTSFQDCEVKHDRQYNCIRPAHCHHSDRTQRSDHHRRYIWFGPDLDFHGHPSIRATVYQPPFGHDDYAMFLATVRSKILLVEKYTLKMISGIRHHVFRTRPHCRRQRVWQSEKFDQSSRTYRAAKGAVTRRVF